MLRATHDPGFYNTFGQSTTETLGTGPDDDNWDDVEFPASSFFSTDFGRSVSSTTDSDVDPLYWLQHEQDVSGVLSSVSLYDSDSSRFGFSLGARSDDTAPSSVGEKEEKEMFVDFEDGLRSEDLENGKRNTRQTVGLGKTKGAVIRLGGHRKVVDSTGDWDEDLEIPENGLSLSAFTERKMTMVQEIEEDKEDPFNLSDLDITFDEDVVGRGVQIFVTSIEGEAESSATQKSVNNSDLQPAPYADAYSTDMLGDELEIPKDMNILQLSTRFREQSSDDQPNDWVTDLTNLSGGALDSVVQPSTSQVNAVRSLSANSLGSSEDESFDDIVFPESMDKLKLSVGVESESPNPPPAAPSLQWHDSDEENFLSGIVVPEDTAFLMSLGNHRNVKHKPQPVRPVRQLERHVLPVQVFFTPQPSRIPRPSLVSSNSSSNRLDSTPSKTANIARSVQKINDSISLSHSSFVSTPPRTRVSSTPSTQTLNPALSPFTKPLGKRASSPSLRSASTPTNGSSTPPPSSPLRRTTPTLGSASSTSTLKLPPAPQPSRSTELRMNLLSKRASSAQLRTIPSPASLPPPPPQPQPQSQPQPQPQPSVTRALTWSGSPARVARPATTATATATVTSEVKTVKTANTLMIMRKPKRRLRYGDGTELDGFDDLPTSALIEEKFRKEPMIVASHTFSLHLPNDRDKVKPHTTSNLRLATRESSKSGGLMPQGQDSQSVKQGRRQPNSIRQLETPKTKVIGDMTYNPAHRRWEGNESALRDFDSGFHSFSSGVPNGPSARPALISNLGAVSKIALVVGNMVFDPERMCWVKNPGAGNEDSEEEVEEEEDPFAGMDDDDDNDERECDGGREEAQTSMVSLEQARAGLPGRRASVGTRARPRAFSASGAREFVVGTEFDLTSEAVDRWIGEEMRHRDEMGKWVGAMGARLKNAE
ncbi:hypothetical protein BC936DRAFT_140026, partial [Jimgerdemannia flammicorona]